MKPNNMQEPQSHSFQAQSHSPYLHKFLGSQNSSSFTPVLQGSSSPQTTSKPIYSSHSESLRLAHQTDTNIRSNLATVPKTDKPTLQSEQQQFRGIRNEKTSSLSLNGNTQRPGYSSSISAPFFQSQNQQAKEKYCLSFNNDSLQAVKGTTIYQNTANSRDQLIRSQDAQNYQERKNAMEVPLNSSKQQQQYYLPTQKEQSHMTQLNNFANFNNSNPIKSTEKPVQQQNASYSNQGRGSSSRAHLAIPFNNLSLKESSSTKGRYSYSRSLTDNFQENQAKQRPSSNNIKGSPANSFSGQPNSSQNTTLSSNQKQLPQQFKQVQTSSSFHASTPTSLSVAQKESLNHQNLFQAIPKSSHNIAYQPQKHPGDNNITESQQSSNSCSDRRENQESSAKSSFTSSTLREKQDAVSSRQQPQSTGSDTNFGFQAISNPKNILSHKTTEDITPSKSRIVNQNPQVSHSFGLNIETTHLRYEEINSPNIKDASSSFLKSYSNSSTSAGSLRNPYNLGLYQGKSAQFKPKEQVQLQSQIPQENSQNSFNTYSISKEQTSKQINNNPSNLGSILNQEGGQQNKGNQKTSKLTVASFVQLKSPVGANKAFLSPQQKQFSINGMIAGSQSSSNAATSRKLSQGENLHIFSNVQPSSQIFQSASFSHQRTQAQGNIPLKGSFSLSNTKSILSTSIPKEDGQISQSREQGLNSASINTLPTKGSASAQNLNKISSELITKGTNKQQTEQQSSYSANPIVEKKEKHSLSNHISSVFQQQPVMKSSLSEKENNNQDSVISKPKSIHNEKGQVNSVLNNQPKPDDDLNYERSNFDNLPSHISDLISQTQIPNHERTKFSIKRNGIVKSYAANTNQGLVRNYNEDRVSIILNIMKPQGKNTDADVQWPKCSFFGVYDGHGGVACADFLRDNLHQFVIKDPHFPLNPKEAIINGFDSAEKQFLKQAQEKEGAIEKAGSCAIVVMIVGTRCFVANVGDSRAIMSGNGGQKAYDLSRDHKPLDDIEQKRITEAGGKIYQTKIMNFQNSFGSIAMGAYGQSNQAQPIYGPHRVLPGRLSVTRTFGDIEAKLPKLGGNPNVVIATPDIKEFEITSELDFILLASDGIFDKLSTKEAIESIWKESKIKRGQYQSVHDFSGIAVDTIFKFALGRKTMDNITVVMIGFDNFKKQLFPSQKQKDHSVSPNNFILQNNFENAQKKQINEAKQDIQSKLYQTSQGNSDKFQDNNNTQNQLSNAPKENEGFNKLQQDNISNTSVKYIQLANSPLQPASQIFQLASPTNKLTLSPKHTQGQQDLNMLNQMSKQLNTSSQQMKSTLSNNQFAFQNQPVKAFLQAAQVISPKAEIPSNKALMNNFFGNKQESVVQNESGKNAFGALTNKVQPKSPLVSP